MKFFPLKYMNIYYDEHKRLLEYRWKPNSENMTADEYRQNVTELLKIMKTFEPQLLLGDGKNQAFPLNLELQQWLVDEVLQKFIEYGVQKFAFINSENLFIEMAYEQVFAEALVAVEFFDTREEAYNWLVRDEVTAGTV